MSKMIVTEIFTVTGNTDVDDDIIFCRRLAFVGPNAQLVIKPKKGAPQGAQRILKIVTNVIDSTLAGGSGEITYNLDGDYFPNYETPVTGDLGLDPETQAKTGDDGTPSFNQGPIPLPDIASPNFDIILDPLHFVGNYPRALDGGSGKPGGRGNKGVNGVNAPIVEIWVTEIDGKLVLDLKGQQGGIGGKGGNGEIAGNGQAGSVAVPGTDTTWLGIPNLTCKQGPGLGGDGGKGGNAGCGGDGGDGGNGGTAKIFYTSAVNLANVTPNLQKGKGGQPGSPGIAGKGGKSGPAGANLPPCLPALVSQDGADGDPCLSDIGDKRGGVAQPGADGIDGKYYTYPIKAIPQMPGLFP
jgi:hypothetical protein